MSMTLKNLVFEPAEWSECLYVTLAPSHIHMFKFFLEAYENVGYMTVINRWSAVLKVCFSPHQRTTILEVLDDMADTIPFAILPSPATKDDIIFNFKCAF